MLLKNSTGLFVSNLGNRNSYRHHRNRLLAQRTCAAHTRGSLCYSI